MIDRNYWSQKCNWTTEPNNTWFISKRKKTFQIPLITNCNSKSTKTDFCHLSLKSQIDNNKIVDKWQACTKILAIKRSRCAKLVCWMKALPDECWNTTCWRLERYYISRDASKIPEEAKRMLEYCMRRSELPTNTE